MSRYTLEFRTLVDDKDFVIFDFDYNLFDNSLKPEFELLFCEYFYFRDIGHETVDRFKFELRNKLNMLYPYYKEYWKTVKQVEVEKFMETKDLHETFTRTIEGEVQQNSTSNQNSTTNQNSSSTNKFSDTPRGEIGNIERFMSQASINDDNSNTLSTLTGNDTSNQNNRVSETTEFHSVGDLGVSSSGLLIQGWRDVITNIYQLMFDDMEELFFGLY